MKVKNPIPHSGLFATPTLEDVQKYISNLPTKEQAQANMLFMFTLNACHAMAQKELERMADQLERV